MRALISGAHQEYLFSKSSPMFSEKYLSQFRSDLWYAAVDGLGLISLPNSRFFVQKGWSFLFQLFSFLLVVVVIYRNREELKKSTRWIFLAERPVSSALLIAILSSVPFFEYLPISDSLRLGYTIVGGISCVRLLGLVIDGRWQRHAAYGVMTLFIITEILMNISLPFPLTRLYILLASLVAIRFLWHWSQQDSNQDELGYFVWLIRSLIGFFIVIVIAVFLRNAGIATYLFKSTIISMALMLPCILFIYMIYGGLNWVFFLSPVWQVKLLRNDAQSLVRKVGLLFVAAIVGYGLLPATLMVWNLHNTMSEAIMSIYTQGFYLGTQRITLAMIIIIVGIIYMASLTSQILPKILLDEKVSGRKMTRGVKRSIGQLMRYCIIFVGFLLAVSMLGFDFDKITIILSAFGIGIGFGLQGLVNNFVSGLVLLFERPLTEGDTIEIGTERAHIKKIGLRSTIVRTLDQADLIIPNADLISNQVINWTLTNREVRLRVPVGVAYGSDVSLVAKTILACAKKHKEVVKSPLPEVLFMNFGDSSLDFELRVWIQDIDRRVQVKSALYHEIERKFREVNVVIPFPQRDLHLRGFDDSAELSPLIDTSEAGDVK